jgi:hypothetical protein
MIDADAARRERRRKYWTRENAHLWIRHDAERFFRTREDFEKACGIPASIAAAPAAGADPHTLELAWERYALRREIAELRLDCLRARWLRKYNPDQPRVPAGNPDGGQWTNEGGGASVRLKGRTMQQDGLQRMLDFLNFLKKKKIHFFIEQDSDDSLLVTFTLVGARIETMFSVEEMTFSVFRGTENVLTDEKLLQELIRENWD